MKYSELLKLCKEKIDAALAPLRAMEMKKKAELEICKIESKLAEKEQMIQELSSKYPIDYEKIIDAIDDLELTELRKERFQKLIKDLF